MPSLRDTLARTRNSLVGRIQTVLGQADISEETWDDLEALLLQSDIGAPSTEKLLTNLRARATQDGIVKAQALRGALKEELVQLLGAPEAFTYDSSRLLEVIMVVGVNGSGKTTSIAKLSQLYTQHGRKIILAAADTFRAAAIDQLQIWGERSGVPVIAGAPNSDPGAVVYDAVQAAFNRKADLLIVDTAGRLHTKHNLMQELKKLRNVVSRSVHDAPHQTLLVIDAANGQNAINQVKGFADAIGVTGVILTKLDGTPKGGVTFAIVNELGIPIRYIGTGEKMGDMEEFNPQRFVDNLFDEKEA
jgi:fused signal recognition particle receptor